LRGITSRKRRINPRVLAKKTNSKEDRTMGKDGKKRTLQYSFHGLMSPSKEESAENEAKRFGGCGKGRILLSKIREKKTSSTRGGFQTQCRPNEKFRTKKDRPRKKKPERKN